MHAVPVHAVQHAAVQKCGKQQHLVLRNQLYFYTQYSMDGVHVVESEVESGAELPEYRTEAGIAFCPVCKFDVAGCFGGAGCVLYPRFVARHLGRQFP